MFYLSFVGVHLRFYVAFCVPRTLTISIHSSLFSQGWGSAAPIGGTNASFVSGGIANQSTLRPSTGPAGAGITIAPGDINYVVERCEVCGLCCVLCVHY